MLKSLSISNGVKTEVGSSKINILGLFSKALTISTVCLSPTDKELIGESRFRLKPYLLQISTVFSFNF